MDNHLFAVIGHQSVTELKPRHFIDLLKGIEKKGLLGVASRTRQHLCTIMRYALQKGRVKNSAALNLAGVVTGKRMSPSLIPGVEKIAIMLPESSID
nr:hypothetical protein [Dickeya dadantii]